MTTQTAINETQALPPRLAERIQSLGVCVLHLEAKGVATLCNDATELEKLVVGSPLFSGVMRRAWDVLEDNAGSLVALWPGVWLAPLPAARRRRVGAKPRKSMHAVLFLGPEVLASEQLQLICDTAERDVQVTLARVDRSTLTGEREAARLAATMAWMQEDASEIDRRFGELRTLSTELAESYEELSLLYKISTNMTLDRSPQSFLHGVCRDLVQTLDLGWMALQLIDDEPRLQDIAGLVVADGENVEDARLLKRLGTHMMERFGGFDHPTVIDDTQQLGLPALPRLGKNLLVVPLRVGGVLLGVLFGGAKRDDEHINSVDSKLCNSLAGSLTIFLENRMLYEDAQAMFIGTLHALTSAIDAKDSYTRGHSERVALMSRRLAEAAGLDEQVCERVYLAGLVHDLGKIGVPEAVLRKAGPLSDAEFEEIKKHPEIGAGILCDIRQMQDLIPGVLYHHEQWSGTGYPHNLAGEDIPLYGRLIGLADAFDAMSSNRTYRSSMDLEAVLAEIERCAGTQFDPALASIFVKLDFTEYFSLIQKHQVHTGEEADCED